MKEVFDIGKAMAELKCSWYVLNQLQALEEYDECESYLFSRIENLEEQILKLIKKMEGEK